MNRTSDRTPQIGMRVTTRDGQHGVITARYDIWAEVKLDNLIGHTTTIAASLFECWCER